MKKQILSISLAAALAVSCTGIAMAEDKTPTVFVNQGQIFFDDQTPVILGEGTTLVLSLIHISEPTRRTPISYAVFCLKKKKNY